MKPALKTRFIGASQLFGAYFHQDWKRESKTHDENVLRFVRSERDAVRMRTIRDIEVLIFEFRDDDALDEALTKLGNHFDAPRVERSYRDWLERVLVLLRQNPG
jgi:hypothetical protein